MMYWRRRFLTLVAGLAVLAVIAWAFSGVMAVGGRAAASAGHGSPGRQTRPAGGDGNGSASGSGVPQTSQSATPAPSLSTPPGIPAAASPTPGAARPPGPTGAAACKPGEVVLSLFSSQGSYGSGQLPEFDVDVVSTAARTCAFNVGPRFLTLVITAGGKRIWSSADCVAGPGSLLTDLPRGVPTVLPLSWDRETSAPGCKVTSRQVTAGSFAAAASDSGMVSNPLTFTLS